MKNISEHLDFVKSQAEFHERMAERFSSDKRRSEQHLNTAGKFSDAYMFFKNCTENKSLSDFSGAESLHLSLEELDGLPDEVLAELSISDSDKTDFSIITLINNAGGIASLDRIIFKLYKETGELVKRANLNARLYRMVQKEQIYSVPGKKGVYSTTKISPNEEEAPEQIISGT